MSKAESQVKTHYLVNLLPKRELATGHLLTHARLIESLYLSGAQVCLQVLFFVSEKYPDGHCVTHFPVKGLEKYPAGHTATQVPH